MRARMLPFLAWRARVPALLAQPLLSNMAWLPGWDHLRSRPRVVEPVAPSCAFLEPSEFARQPFLKRFRFLTVNMVEESAALARVCLGAHRRVPLTGRAAAQSAVYNAGLAQALAGVMQACLRARDDELLAAHIPLGSERLGVSELLMSVWWQETRSWRWRTPWHTTLLESPAAAALQTLIWP